MMVMIMNNNEYTTIGLYNHNADSYNHVKSSFESGKDIVAIVHATGTGKSYNALQLAYDNKDKKIVYVVPSCGIIEHINQIIEDNPNLDLKRDFPNLEFRTYQSFISLSKDEIAAINCELLILDEFHHIGAPVWGARINTMVETHPDMKIFGMTAYTVRDKGTPYERDMANPETDELFSDKVESRYDLCDAMIDGVLPKPVYKSAYTNLIGIESYLEEKVQKLGATTKEYQEYMTILNDVKKRIHEAPSIPNILKKSIKPNGKYIYFCPPCSEEGSNDIETIKQQAILWFKGFISEEDIIIYTSTSDMGEDGKKNRDAFYRDVNLDGENVGNKLRVMFAINQYNEGIHAPNIDGVIMGRGTTSDIVYFEQLGRALSVRGNTKDKFDELEQYSTQQLISMCKEKDIPIKDNITKEELIEKLIAPVVIDLTNNYAFIKNLENNLKDRIKDIQEHGLGSHCEIKIRDASFDIEIENQDLFEMLRYIMDRMTMTWEDKYKLAKVYYEHNGDLEIPSKFRTINGYEFNENGVHLGQWIVWQRKAYYKKENSIISLDRIQLLNEIGMIWDTDDYSWMRMYKLAKAYYEHHGNLKIFFNFKTINGYEPDENGVALGSWITNQRTAYNKKGHGIISPDRIQLLNEIGMIFDVHDENWMRMYELAKVYYEHHGDLEISSRFRTINGYEPDENGVALGNWISTQRQTYNKKGNSIISPNRIQLLNEIGMIFDKRDGKWMRMYELAKVYYVHNGDLEIPLKFRTINGYEFNENGVHLGEWISTQRQAYYKKGHSIISPDRIQLLNEIGMIWDTDDYSWMRMYKLAKAYYAHHGDLKISSKFRTINGYEFNENGVRLGQWITNQRQTYNKKGHGIISPDRIQLLNEIGMIFDVYDENWMRMYELAKVYYEHHGDLEISSRFRTINGYEFNENGVRLGQWIVWQRQAYYKKRHGIISPDRIQLLNDIGMIWFEEKLNKKLQDEQITPENLERKTTEIQNRFYSVLNNHNSDSLPSSEELNQEFLEQLNIGKKM